MKEFLDTQWAVIEAAPLVFIFGLVVFGAAAYGVSRWYHRGIIETLRERLTCKDERLDAYRDRLDLAPVRGSEFSKLSDKELQSAALRFVDNLRDWNASRNAAESLRQQQQWAALTRATDETHKKRLWDAHTADITATSMQRNSEYDAKFKVRAIVLRDELLIRVKHPDPTSIAHRMYDHPNSPVGMAMVADDLERLARLLS
ncbi:MAG TPA: hypothetical protein VH183_04790 [Burkholderiaceae bacterium]|nr:hypothetical protein [Burkholderiaceae bacterium]